MKKPELLVTAGTMGELTRLIDAGADAVNIGEQKYGVRMPGDFTPEAVEAAVRYAHNKGAKIYVSVNNIMDNAILAELPGYLGALHKAAVDAVVFGDPAVLMAMKQSGIRLPLHWNAEMTSTNYATANYWGTKGATRVVLARELNMEQVLEIKRNAALDVQVQVHGMTNIYHSKRTLVTNYVNHLEHDTCLKDEAVPGKGMYLVEAERQDEKFPVYEDMGGTHIMSSEDLCMLENLHELIEGGIDSFKIEGLMKPADYNETVVRMYRKAIDAYAADPEGYVFNADWLEEIERIQPPERPLSFGFFFKEQVY
jgi:putative protease